MTSLMDNLFRCGLGGFVVVLMAISAPLFAQGLDERTDPDEGFESPYDDADDQNPMETAGSPIESARRDLPTLKAREPEPATLGESLLWIPRVVLFPVYVVTEYVVRWPLGVATRFAERKKIPEWIEELTTWDDGNAQVFPVVRFSSGFAFGMGAGIIWNNMLADRNDWGLQADYANPDNLTVELTTRYRALEDQLTLRLGGRSELRDDFVYFGAGPDTQQSDETRFARTKHMGFFDTILARSGPGFGGKVRMELSTFDFGCAPRFQKNATDICASPIFERSDLVGFEPGYSLGRVSGALFYDSRRPYPASGTGVRVELTGRYAKGLSEDDLDVEFVDFGARTGVFWDVWKGRVLSLEGRVRAAEPFGGSEIPFGELLTLGGIEAMRGFPFARFHGRSTVVGSARYQYPVWSFFDGYLVAEAGNAFGARLEDFDVAKLRASFAVGLTTVSSRNNSLDILLAFGSTRFEEEFSIETARLVLGTRWGI